MKTFYLLLISILISKSIVFAQLNTDAEETFNKLKNLEWKEVFYDPGTKKWEKKWFLDGLRASAVNTPKGIVFSAGPVTGDQGSHAVLWTHQSFKGDLKIEFDFTRLDAINRDVLLIYIQATGIGEGEFVKDIYAWRHLREVPYMQSYFNNMHLLHISFAALGGKDVKGQPDYVRARRYPHTPGENFNKTTEIPPTYWDTGLFKPGVPYRITLIKTNDKLFMIVENKDSKGFFHWDTSAFSPITEGRLGFRHMWARCARYGNIKISELK